MLYLRVMDLIGNTTARNLGEIKYHCVAHYWKFSFLTSRELCCLIGLERPSLSLPVEGHEDEGVDADEDGDDDEVLHRGAPEPTEGPD